MEGFSSPVSGVRLRIWSRVCAINITRTVFAFVFVLPCISNTSAEPGGVALNGLVGDEPVDAKKAAHPCEVGVVRGEEVEATAVLGVGVVLCTPLAELRQTS